MKKNCKIIAPKPNCGNQTGLSGIPLSIKFAAGLTTFLELFYDPFQKIEERIKKESDPKKIDFLKGRQMSIYKDYKKHLQIEFHRAQLRWELAHPDETNGSTFTQDKIATGVFYRDLAYKFLNNKKHISLLLLMELSVLSRHLNPNFLSGAPLDALSGIKSAAKTIAKNVKNAFKNLSLPEITNNSGYEIDDIPETLADRKAMLERMLVPLIGTKKYCTGLRDFAEITGGSVPEICYHASKNKASTLAALCLLDVIAAAKYIPPPTPPHGSTQAKRHISEMYELRCKIKWLGVVKLTIGKRAYNSDMVYCITKFRFDKITKK